MNAWQFFDDHWFIAWCALWLCWSPYFIVIRLLRLVGVALRGWPPAYLNADSDWKSEKDEKEQA